MPESGSNLQITAILLRWKPRKDTKTFSTASHFWISTAFHVQFQRCSFWRVVCHDRSEKDSTSVRCEVSDSEESRGHRVFVVS